LAGKRSGGIAGSAVLVGTAGLYLVYAGVRDVPIVDGLRQLLRRETPTPRAVHSPYIAQVVAGGVATINAIAPSDGGIEKLVGNAAAAYPVFRAMGNWKILGWGLRPDLSSDHPKGLALDIMTTSNADAQAIIAKFKTLPGAKYWIWNRRIGNISRSWRDIAYTGASPHTDHVHLSFS